MAQTSGLPPRKAGAAGRSGLRLHGKGLPCRENSAVAEAGSEVERAPVVIGRAPFTALGPKLARGNGAPLGAQVKQIVEDLHLRRPLVLGETAARRGDELLLDPRAEAGPSAALLAGGRATGERVRRLVGPFLHRWRVG